MRKLIIKRLIHVQSSKREKQYEQERLHEVFAEIDKQKEQLLAKSGDIKESVVHLRKEFWDDVTVNIDNVDEMVETQASIRQQAELLSERERTHSQLHNQFKKLEQLEDSPYFARIDFQEDGEEIEQIYIGRVSLMDEDNVNFLVYDWRAPIASMYYDFTPGPAYFEALDSKIEGKIHLKRQFIIERGEFLGMFDTGLTIGDHLLQKALSGQASTKMQSIVATIQREQNKVIRHEKSKFLVVQGAAGSGKTSAALQRIAYLLYRHRDILHEENMVLFSPNDLFSSYIANVLPELGEENIRQMTFLRFIDRNIKNLRVETPFEQTEYVLSKRDSDDYPLRRENISFKSNLSYKNVIDHYIEDLYESGIVFENIMFRDEVFIHQDEIAKYFYQIERNVPLMNKMNILRYWLLDRIEQLRAEEVLKDWVLGEVELLDDEAFREAYVQVQENDIEEFHDSGKEEIYLRRKVVDREIDSIVTFINQFRFVDVLQTYQKMFTDWTPKGEVPNNWEKLCDFTVQHIKDGWLTWEEATAFSYFSDTLLGDSANRSMKHIIIDEAQDYTPFQLAYLKQIFPHTSFTLLGDMNQAIYAETEENNILKRSSDDEFTKIELMRSYRSTKEITEFSREFSPAGKSIKTFERTGSKPKVLKTTEEELAHMIEQEIASFQEKGYETIAIVCQTKKEAKYIQNKLSNALNIQEITEMTKEYSKGIVILPIYLAKGVEFDAVIIPDASSQKYQKEDRTLFYTACTRAMHDLTIFSTKDWCSFIHEANPATYTKK